MGGRQGADDVGSSRDEHIGHAFFGRLGSPMPSVIASVWSYRKASARCAARRPDAGFSLRCADRGRASEHAVVVGRFLRYLLDNIPVLHDLAILEAEKAHKCSSRVFWIFRLEITIRMGCDQTALRDDALDCQPLFWVPSP